jgi:O-antigen/teichoic acid export membrane protein
LTSLSQRTARAAKWRVASAGATALLQLAIGISLARLLDPADFGVMALALIALGLTQSISQMGLGGAIVQRQTITDRHVRVGFTCSLVLGLAMAGIVIAAAPLAADLTGNPSVTALLRVLAVTLPIRGLGVAAEALLRRRLDFKRQCLIDAVSLSIGYGGAAVVLAVSGAGVWSLVWGTVVQSAITSTGQLAAARHSLRPLIAGRELADLLHFGVGSALSRVVNFTAVNGDNFAVGRWLGVASLGLYERAYSLMLVPSTYVAGVMTGVLLPALAQVQSEPARLRRAYLLATRLTAVVAAPAMVTIIVAAPYLVPAAYGERWTGAVLPLQILCAAGYFRALYHVGTAVAQSVGRVYAELLLQLIYAALVIGGAVLASSQGLPMVAATVGGAILFMFVAVGQLALRATQTSWVVYFAAQLEALATAAATALAAIAVRLTLEAYQTPGLVVLAAVLAAAAVPWSVGLLWTITRPDFREVLGRLPGWPIGIQGESSRSHTVVARFLR